MKLVLTSMAVFFGLLISNESFAGGGGVTICANGRVISPGADSGACDRTVLTMSCDLQEHKNVIEIDIRTIGKFSDPNYRELGASGYIGNNGKNGYCGYKACAYDFPNVKEVTEGIYFVQASLDEKKGRKLNVQVKAINGGRQAHIQGTYYSKANKPEPIDEIANCRVYELGSD